MVAITIIIKNSMNTTCISVQNQYIESLTKDGRTITYSMMRDSYWYPNIGPYIKNIEVFHRWTRNNHMWWRKCVYQENTFRDACKEMNKKEIQDYLKRAGLKGFPK